MGMQSHPKAHKLTVLGRLQNFCRKKRGFIPVGAERVATAVCLCPQSSRKLSFSKTWTLQNGKKPHFHRFALFNIHLHMHKECKEKLTFVLR